MDIAGLLLSLKNSGLASAIRDSVYVFPMIESFHVIGLTLVFGSIAVIDFRMLGLASTRRPVSRVMGDILKWTWMAFALTVITGVLMFITNADVYYGNLFFRVKILLLAIAGANMMVFELTTGRTIARWDTDTSASRAGRIAAALSLLLWIGVIFMGRWVGFTTGSTDVELDPGISADDLFSAPPTVDDAPK